MKFILKTKAQGATLEEYINDRSRVCIIIGPLGSGKTFASCERIFKSMCEQRPNRDGVRKSRWFAIRNTYSELFTTTIKDFLDLFESLGHFSKGGMQPPQLTLKFSLADKTKVHSELIFIALDRPQAIKKLRGAQLTGGWLNEVKEIPKEVLDMLDFRIGRYPSPMDGGPSWYGIIGDTNQCEDDHWLYELAEETKPEGWKFLKQPGGLVKNQATKEWEENPQAENIQNLPPGYYIKGKEGKTDDWINVNLGNNYGTVEDGRPIFKEQYHDEIHINESLIYNPNEIIVIGLDFGLTPSAIITQPSIRGGVNFLDEIVSSDMGIQQFTEQLLLPKLTINFPDAKEIYFIGDPAGNRRADTNEETVFKVLSTLGIDCEPANTNDVDVRLEAVRYYLESMRDGKPALQIHPKCKMTRKGFNGGYKFRRLQVVGEKRFTDIPMKNKFSHIHDAIQYVCMWYKGSVGINIEKKKKEVDDFIQKYKQMGARI